MRFVFRELIEDHHTFFELLPQDWQDEIVPHWNGYKDSSNIYIITENDHIIGGGVVFSTCPPDVEYYKSEAQHWFDNGYLYLGFIWIDEQRRNMNLGSFWLQELKKQYPNQNYWLLIEDEHLHGFYQKNDFILVKTISNNNLPEWLYAFKSHSS